MGDIEDEGNAILANLMSSSTPIQAPTFQQPPPPPPPTTTGPTTQEWRAQRTYIMRLLAEGSIVPALRLYLQREYKITDQELAELTASSSH